MTCFFLKKGSVVQLHRKNSLVLAEHKHILEVDVMFFREDIVTDPIGRIGTQIGDFYGFRVADLAVDFKDSIPSDVEFVFVSAKFVETDYDEMRRHIKEQANLARVAREESV